MFKQGLSDIDRAAYGKSGMFIPLNYYYEHSSYHIKQNLERTADKNLLSLVISPDGNIYTIFRYAESIEDHPYLAH